VFPAIADAIKTAARSVRDAFDDQPVSLSLKETIGVGTTNIGGTADWYRVNGYNSIYSILSAGGPAWSGERVTIHTALNHSVVWACNRIISETVGFLPLIMMQNTPTGKRVALEHPMYRAFHDAPNAEMTAMSFRESRTSQCVLNGNGFAQILRRSGTGTAIELRALDQSQVLIDREKTGDKRLVYVVKDGNDTQTFTVQRGKPQDILHIRGLGSDGVRGYSVIGMARQSIGTALAVERHVARFYANGGRVPYVLNMEKKFGSDKDFDQFRADWEKTYSEPHKAPILENGTKYQPIGLNATDSQMLQTRLFSINEICRWFSVSPHLVGDLSKATFSNIEQLALEFVKLTLTSWLKRWEGELWRCVLTPQEQAEGYYFRHNLDALLRGDFVTRCAGYATLLQNGVTNVNEVRDLEDWNPVNGGDVHHIQLNMASIPGSAVPLTATADTPGLVRLGDPTTSAD
jgi:HK97 family phage portal protein